MFFKTKRNNPLLGLRMAFSNRVGIGNHLLIRFLFSGSILRDNQTPNELEMEDGNIIHATSGNLDGVKRILEKLGAMAILSTSRVKKEAMDGGAS